MKKVITLLAVASLALFISMLAQQPGADYVVLAWNDLGMHCSNKDFSKIAILPPYNNLMAQVISRGDADNMPKVVTTEFELSYSIPGNTYSVGKTNFWDYEDKLFGVTLADNVGLTGKGLTGTFELKDNYFIAEGIPVTPFQDNDLQNESPFQLASVKLVNLTHPQDTLQQTRAVIPVSNEISCVSSGCHSSENHILDEHEDEDEGGFNKNNTPILCASCHSSNALGTQGKPGIKSLSYVIHEKHAEKTNDCYKCHPGNSAQCLRGAMFQAGKKCQDCHGSLKQVAESIEEDGRRPWLDEPGCQDCHDQKYATNPNTLYRLSKGHGGLYCSACHGSPHAIYPSVQPNDNAQMIAYQGFAGKLSDCTVCHGVIPSSPGPHGFLPSGIKQDHPESTEFKIEKIYPNPFNNKLNLMIHNNGNNNVRIAVYDQAGRHVLTAHSDFLPPGGYTVDINTSSFAVGAYNIIMESGGKRAQIKAIKK